MRATAAPRPSWHRNVALLVPLLLVNAAAIYGQSGWAYDHLRRGGWLWAVLFAAAVESVGIYLAAEAHAALMAQHASGALRMGSYAVGLASGALNYAHFSDNMSPTALALTFGVLSSISPWLWAIRSRSINRVRLAAMGLIDPRAVKFSRLRWLLFLGKTFGAFRLAVWNGTQSPAAAVAAYDARRVELAAAKAARKAAAVEAIVEVADTAVEVPAQVERPEWATQLERDMNELAAELTRNPLPAARELPAVPDPEPEPDPEPDPEPVDGDEAELNASMARHPAGRRRAALNRPSLHVVPPQTSSRRVGNANRPTSTKARVAQLAAAGKTVPEIVAELGVTRRSVERHLKDAKNDVDASVDVRQ